MVELTTEDYENIWLRIKDRYGRWYRDITILVVSIAALIGFLGGYFVSGSLIEPRVNAYMATDKFRERVTARVFENLPAAEERVNVMRGEIASLHAGIQGDIETLRRALSEVAAQPYEVGHGRLSFLGAGGTRVTIQFGQGSGSGVEFSQPFKSVPVVLISGVGGALVKQPGFLGQVTERGFTVPREVNDPFGQPRTIHWIAVGD